MDNIRVALWLTLLAMLWLAYTAWVTDHPPPLPPPEANSATPSAGGPAPNNLPDQLPSLQGSQSAPPPPAPLEAATSAPPTDVVHVRTDVLDVLIDLRGAAAWHE